MTPVDTSSVDPPVHKQEPHLRCRHFRWVLVAPVAAAALIALAAPAGARSTQPGTPTAQPVQHAQATGESQSPPEAVHAGDVHGSAAQGEHGEEHAASSPWGTVGRIFNFAVLAVALVYLLRSPFASYLRERSVSIRADLAKAAELRESASRQLTEIEARMRALPGEIQALTRRGAEEIGAEEARILAAAEAERNRMLEQARREIDLQLRLAERMLRRRAGELAVDLATERVRRTMDRADHVRLVDRYLAQVESRAGSEAGGLAS